MDLFQVRMQDFGGIAAEVRRFATFPAKVPLGALRENAPFSIFVQQTGPSGRASIVAGGASARTMDVGAPRWRLLVKHPSGSLEVAVNAARRRNLVISSSVLAVLGTSCARRSP
jgi:hypothetical protein